MWRVFLLLSVALSIYLMNGPFAANWQHFNIVSTESGHVRGQVQQTLLDQRNFYSFRGIPYAQAPVNELRFKPPKAPQPWSDIKDALAYGNVCPHFNIWLRKYVGDEDCLFVNVFTPTLTPNEPLPVIFAIHGGGLRMDSSDWMGPELLLNHDVILVTINYRLGALGFLSLANAKYPGNYGLKDMVLALQWTKQNIRHFGGDPNKVTVYGYSAGAAAVHYLLLSPKSRDLFQRAIISSGSALVPWAFNSKGDNRAALQEFAEEHDGASGPLTDDEFDELLTRIDAVELVKNEKALWSSTSSNKGLFQEYLPVVEVAEAEEAFFIETPEKLMDKVASEKDVIFGFNSAESIILIKDELNNPHLFDAFDEDFYVRLPLREVQWSFDSQEYGTFAKQMRQFYLGTKSVANSLSETIDLLSDTVFGYSTHLAAKRHTQKATGNTYFYIFSVEGQLNFFRRLSNASALGLNGASHVDEMGYVFKLNVPGVVADDAYTSLAPSDVAIIRQWTKVFADFALYGNPAPIDKSFEWRPIQDGNIAYANFTNNGVEAGTNAFAKRFAFWNEFYSNFTRR